MPAGLWRLDVTPGVASLVLKVNYVRLTTRQAAIGLQHVLLANLVGCHVSIQGSSDSGATAA